MFLCDVVALGVGKEACLLCSVLVAPLCCVFTPKIGEELVLQFAGASEKCRRFYCCCSVASHIDVVVRIITTVVW